jgi:hypothetical protein
MIIIAANTFAGNVKIKSIRKKSIIKNFIGHSSINLVHKHKNYSPYDKNRSYNT